VPELHGSYRFGDPGRLTRIRRRRMLARGDSAEAAGAGADVAQKQEGGRAFRPALMQVRAHCRPADGMQTVVVEQLAGRSERRACSQSDLEPVGFFPWTEVHAAGNYSEVEKDFTNIANPVINARYRQVLPWTKLTEWTR